MYKHSEIKKNAKDYAKEIIKANKDPEIQELILQAANAGVLQELLAFKASKDLLKHKQMSPAVAKKELDRITDEVQNKLKKAVCGILKEENFDQALKNIILTALFQCKLIKNFDLSQAKLENINLKGIDLSEAKLEGAYLKNTNLFRANLTGANLFKAHLSHAKLARANLAEAILERAILENANLFEANLSGAKLENADLTKAKLRGTNLSQSNLIIADLSQANLSNAKLKNANLSQAILRNAKLENANLAGAVLLDANLSEADLTNAYLFKADLSSANLFNANLKNAYLVAAKLNAETVKVDQLLQARSIIGVQIDCLSHYDKREKKKLWEKLLSDYHATLNEHKGPELAKAIRKGLITNKNSAFHKLKQGHKNNIKDYENLLDKMVEKVSSSQDFTSKEKDKLCLKINMARYKSRLNDYKERIESHKTEQDGIVRANYSYGFFPLFFNARRANSRKKNYIEAFCLLARLNAHDNLNEIHDHLLELKSKNITSTTLRKIVDDYLQLIDSYRKIKNPELNRGCLHFARPGQKSLILRVS